MEQTIFNGILEQNRLNLRLVGDFFRYFESTIKTLGG